MDESQCTERVDEEKARFKPKKSLDSKTGNTRGGQNTFPAHSPGRGAVRSLWPHPRPLLSVTGILTFLDRETGCAYVLGLSGKGKQNKSALCKRKESNVVASQARSYNLLLSQAVLWPET